MAEYVIYYDLVIIDVEGKLPECFDIGKDVTTCVIAEDLKTVVASLGDKIHVVDIESRKVCKTLVVDGYVNDLWVDKGTIYAVTNKNVLSVTRSTSNDVKLPEECTAVTVSNDVAYVGTKLGNLLLVDIRTGLVSSAIHINSSKVTHVAISKSKNLVGVGSSNGNLAVYSIDQAKMLTTDMKYHNMPITAITFIDNDTKCVTAAHERQLHVWDLVGMKHIDAIGSM